MAVTLQVQGRAEDDRVWSFEHLRGLIELFLQLGVPYDLRRLAHLANQLLESAEDTDETAFELIGELWERRLSTGYRVTEGMTYLADLGEGCAPTPLDDGVHQLDFKGLYVLILDDRQLRLLRHLCDPSRYLLHHAQRRRQLLLEFRNLFALPTAASARAANSERRADAPSR